MYLINTELQITVPMSSTFPLTTSTHQIRSKRQKNGVPQCLLRLGHCPDGPVCLDLARLGPSELNSCLLSVPQWFWNLSLARSTIAPPVEKWC